MIAAMAFQFAVGRSRRSMTRTSAGSRIGCSFDLRRGSGKNCTLELAGEEKKSMSV